MKKLKKINKINLLLAVISLVVWTSCKTDKITPIAEPVKDLTGTWRVIKATRNGTDLFTLVDTTTTFGKFTIVFKSGSYTLNNPLPFIVTQNGTYATDNPQYPFQITFTPAGAGSTPVSTAFTYPIVNGIRVLTLVFSPGCPQNTYSYSLEKVN